MEAEQPQQKISKYQSFKGYEICNVSFSSILQGLKIYKSQDREKLASEHL
jgi:hypothetical protein